MSGPRNTYLYCIIALAIIVVLGMFIAYLSVRRKSPLTSLIDTIAMFPYIVPGSVLGITLLLAFNGKGDPMILSGTATIMIISLGHSPPRLHAALQLCDSLPDQSERGRGRDFAGRFADEGVLQGDG